MSIRVCVALLVLSVARAQDPLYDTPLLAAGTYPIDSAAGDVNGDGRTDAVVHNGTDIYLLLQDGDGQLGAPVAQGQVPFLERFLLADVEADGDLDLAGVVDSLANNADDRLVVLKNVGGAFVQPASYDTADNPEDLDVGDLDDDGVLDVAVSPLSGIRVELFFGVGDGSFEPYVDASAGGQPRGLAIGLANDDAFADIVVVRNDGMLVTLLGAGNGSFAAGAPLAIGNGPLDVALGHVDGDLHADALVSYTSPQVRLLLGVGDGSFVAQTPVALLSASASPVLADVDEDGDDDALCLLANALAIPEAAGFAVLLSQGDGTLAPLARYGTGYQPEHLTVADLNHDGDLDLFAPFKVTGAALGGTLLTGHGDGRFGPVVKTGDGPEEMATGDLDLDGLPDLVVACGKNDTVAVHLALGHGEYDAVGPSFFAGDFPAGLAVADAFEDGLPDAIVANRTPGGKVTTLIGDGQGGLGAPVLTLPGAVPFGLGAGDADLDGSVDIALPCSDGKVRVMLGNGLGGFATTATISAASISPDAAAFGDLNGDGLPDLVASTVAAFAVTVARNVGGGAFAPPLQVPITAHNQHDVALGDLDGDQDLDIVTSGGFLGHLNVLLNNGNLSFSAGPLLSAPDTWSVAIGDVSGDGVADVVAGTQTAPFTSAFGSVTTWRGTGGGAFAVPELTYLGNGAQEPVELLLHDADGDGALDALVSVCQAGDLWILPNRQGPWENVGKPLAGVQGLPRQQGFGAMHPGSPFEILLTDARPSGTTWHVVGLSAINAPFKGGTYVPAPLVVTGPWPLDAQGDLSIPGAWPGPAAPGLPLWFQFWQQDPAAVKGWSASNALKLTLP